MSLLLLGATGATANANPQCIDLFAESKVATKFVDKKDFKIISLNAERFFTYKPNSRGLELVRDEAPTSNIAPKAPEKVKELIKIIQDEKPDVLVLQEVIGLHSTKVLDPKQEYIHLVNTPADSSGIHTVFLVKASLGVDAQLVVPNVKSQYVKIHRGLPYIKIRQKHDGKAFSRATPPDLIVIGVHLKAYRNSDGETKFSGIKKLETLALLKLKEELELEYPEAKIMVVGDLNADVNVRPELMQLKSQMQDSLDYTIDPTNRGTRATQTYHAGALTEAAQLDAHFLNQKLLQHLRTSYVYRYKEKDGEIRLYKDGNGNVFPYPTSYDLRAQNISDHYPLVTILDMTMTRVVEKQAVQEYQKQLFRVYNDIGRTVRQWGQNDMMLYEIKLSGELEIFKRWLDTNQLSPYMTIEYTNKDTGVVQFRASFTGLGYLLFRDSSNPKSWVNELHFLAP